MTSLQALQDHFQAYLCAEQEDILSEVVSSEKVDANVRMSIYANAYTARLVDALATTYPQLLAYTGSEEFTKLAHDYIQKYPSTFRSIRWFGDKLPDFLQDTSLLAAANPILVELAKVEWCMTLVFDAADERALAIEDFQTIPPDAWASLQVRLHPSCYGLDLEWNAMEIWQALVADEDPPLPQKSETQSWMLWRRGFENQFCLLPPDDAWALKTIQTGAAFAELCEGLCQWHDEEQAPIKAAAVLKGWILEGLVVNTKTESILVS